jgi:hypothetical protein
MSHWSAIVLFAAMLILYVCTGIAIWQPKLWVMIVADVAFVAAAATLPLAVCT